MQFSTQLIAWYEQAKRDLPWRKDRNPYAIWLSEIILQQTRVAQGLPYFERFIMRFPDVFSLAAAEEQEVLRLWQGLGYYSRARNMLATAREIVEVYQGVFPADFNKLKALKGVGDYTAAAIASMAYDLPHAVVDGNVYRVLARLLGLQEAIDQPAGQRLFREKAKQLLDPHQAGLYNQAIMEFGALCCTPQKPTCNICPFQRDCWAFNRQMVAQLPVKAGKIKPRSRYLNYVLFCKDDGIYLKQRNAGDIWQGLYDFALYESNRLLETTEILPQFTHFFADKQAEMLVISGPDDFRHLLTHQRLFVRFWQVQIFSNLQGNDLIFVGRKALDQYPLPRLMTKYLKSIATWPD